MKRHIGILSLLAVVFLATAMMNPNFLTAYNLENLAVRASLYGILSVGVTFVIITGGIDLSIGSVVGLAGCLLPWLLAEQGWSPWIALPAVLALCGAIGLLHGLLITRLRLQPFVVTLCGLLIYRGVARWITADATQGFGRDHAGLRSLATARIPLGHVPGVGELHLPAPTIFLIVIAAAAAVLLGRTVYGRYLLALGANEQAAQYCGVNTPRMVVAAYVGCSLTAGLGGVLFALDVNSVQPASFGNFYELYAIAAAVLGGCSLRGGEGSVLGAVIGAAILQLLYNAIGVLGVQTTLEYTIIGGVLLLGVVTDELVKRLAARRRAAAEAHGAGSRTQDNPIDESP